MEDGKETGNPVTKLDACTVFKLQSNSKGTILEPTDVLK